MYKECVDSVVVSREWTTSPTLQKKIAFLCSAARTTPWTKETFDQERRKNFILLQ